MKALLVIALLAGWSARPAALGGEPVAALSPSSPTQPAMPRLRVPQPPRAWLGLQVSRPDESITVHIPALPPGIGFIVRSINHGGPADVAGLKEFDVLWKLGDQMLVNEGQLAALLRLSKPGDEITFSGFRGGKPFDAKLTLGEAPPTATPFPDSLVDSAILPGECGGPMRVVNIAEKTASFSSDEGRAEVRREGSAYKVLIEGPKGEEIYRGDLPPDGSLEALPDLWKRRVQALRRGLEHALDGRIVPTRQPRPRVVPPPAPKS